MKNNYLKVDIYFYLYLFLITFFSIVSQYLFKQIEKNGQNGAYNNIYLAIGLAMYTLLGFSIYKLLPYGSLIVLNILLLKIIDYSGNGLKIQHKFYINYMY